MTAPDQLLNAARGTLATHLALTVYRRGERVLHTGDTAARYDLASLTKLYTTTVFLMLGEVDARVVDVIPEFAGVRAIGPALDPHTLALIAPPPALDGHPPIDAAAVTFRHLLTHTSGLRPWTDLYARLPPPQHPTPHLARLAQALAIIAATPFADVPGRQVAYSDLNMILVGAAAARLDHTANHQARTLADLLAQRILTPHALAETGFNPADAARCAPTEDDQRWRRYRVQGVVHDENAHALGGIAGHAGLFGTSDDVARFGLLWLDALAGRGPLPQAGARAAVREQAVTGVERRGWGWALRTPGVSSSGRYFSAESFGHTGFTGTSLWIDPAREVVVALLTNRVYFGRGAEAIMAFRPAMHDAVMQALGLAAE